MAILISRENLALACDRLFDDLRSRGIDNIEFTDDAYLHITMGSQLKIYEDPIIGLRNYEDDVRCIIEEPKSLSFVSYNYVESVCSILQYIVAKKLLPVAAQGG